MKFSTVAVIVVVFALVSAVVALSEVEEQFEQFIKTYGKVYGSLHEKQQRFKIFQQNLERIKLQNLMSEDAKFGVTEFADLTREEFIEKVLSKPIAHPDSSIPRAKVQTFKDLPVEWDWRAHGAVTPVKNQGACGSCWAFSATGNIEGQWFLAGNKLVSLSEQNLVDCDHECMIYHDQKECDAGCNGGLMPNAFSYVMKSGGIMSEDDYKYTARDEACKFKPEAVAAKISNYTMISNDEKEMAEWLYQNGPIAIAADATEWQFYMGGIFDLPCGKTLNHGILIVGYGQKKNILGKMTDYWIVKNSWGSSWGEKGYLLIKRGSGKCGLNLFPSSAIVNPK